MPTEYNNSTTNHSSGSINNNNNNNNNGEEFKMSGRSNLEEEEEEEEFTDENDVDQFASADEDVKPVEDDDPDDDQKQEQKQEQEQEQEQQQEQQAENEGEDEGEGEEPQLEQVEVQDDPVNTNTAESTGAKANTLKSSGKIFANLVFDIDTTLPHDIFVKVSKKITKNGGKIIDDDDSDDDEEDEEDGESNEKTSSDLKANSLNNESSIIKVTMETLRSASSSNIKYVVSPTFIFDSLREGRLLSLKEFSTEEMSTENAAESVTAREEADNQTNEAVQEDTNVQVENVNEDENESDHMALDQENTLTVNKRLLDEPNDEEYYTETTQKPEVKKQKVFSFDMNPTKMSFTPEEDELILAYVRKNPKLRDTHSLYHRIAQVLGNHTGNSVRFRYRSTLSKKLSYVYQVDDNGQLVKDENGDFIKTTTLPKKLKVNYTAEEDYMLCIGVKKQFYSDIFHLDPDEYDQFQQQQLQDQQQKDQARLELHTGENGNLDESNAEISKDSQIVSDETAYLNNILNHEQLSNVPTFKEFKVHVKRGPLTRAFFKNFQMMHPAHTENSWRDRFRKFSLTYGIDKYIDYYEGCLIENITPEPIKNMTTKHAISNRNNLTDLSMSNSESSPFAIGKPGNFSRQFTAALSLVSNEEVGDLFDAASPAALINAAASVVHGSSDLLSNDLEKSDDQEEPSLDQEQQSHRHMQQDQDTQPQHQQQENSDQHELLTKDASTESKNETNNIFDMLSNVELPMEYMEESKQITPSEELCKYYNIDMSQFENDLSKFLLIVSNCTVECLGGSVEEVVASINKEIGIPSSILFKILYCCSNDSSLLTRFFFYSFKQESSQPENVIGIFHNIDDDHIMQDDNQTESERLLSIHGSEYISKRKVFLLESHRD